jgi:Tol biopolymer transport system component
MTSTGQSVTQVTNLPDGACQPTWSPDGKQMIVTSPCAGKRDSYPGSILYIINLDGSGVIPLPSVPGGDYDPKWSPDGQKIAFTSLRDGPPHIFILTLSDRSIISLSSPSNRDRSPSWSPDGKTIAYETNRLGQPQIWVMGVNGENAREFSILSNGFAFSPDWSPDGQTLMYSQGSGLPWLVVRQFNKPGANEVKVNEKLRPIENARFSPDGWWIAYQNNAAGNEDIYIMNQTGADIRQLTNDPKPDYQPAWHP